MPKINVYLPDDLAAAVRDAQIPVSAVCQAALERAVRDVSALRGSDEAPATEEPAYGAFSRFTARPVECSRCSRPRCTPSSLISTPITLKPLRAKTSAMPAPIVPRPTTPIVENVRGVASGEVLVMAGIIPRRPCAPLGMFTGR